MNPFKNNRNTISHKYPTVPDPGNPRPTVMEKAVFQNAFLFICALYMTLLVPRLFDLLPRRRTATKFVTNIKIWSEKKLTTWSQKHFPAMLYLHPGPYLHFRSERSFSAFCWKGEQKIYQKILREETC